jgi:hypothetical protein
MTSTLLKMIQKTKALVKNALQVIREVFYGMTLYDWARELDKTRNNYNRLFTMMVFGHLIGVPILPPYYTLRLIPYIMPTFENWRRSMLRERDLTDLIDQEIG